LGDLEVDFGSNVSGRLQQGFMEEKRKGAVSGSLTLEDLPEAWRTRLKEAAKAGDGRCPEPEDPLNKGFYYFIGKYEVSNFQWRAVMSDECPEPGRPPSIDDPRPKTDISWFEAVDFTKRYTEWLLKHHPEALPRFSRGRVGYLRLPTESEWEYAARGGHLVSESQLNGQEFFPLEDRTYADYAVFTDANAARPPENLAWIGSKCANPLGLFDTAGNASEMMLEPFRFSLGSRLHGAAGGFLVKGGSYRKRKPEIMPGRREEMPFFLEDGAYRNRDLGFRVVLSAIVTPENRMDALERSWASLGETRRSLQPGQGPLEQGIQIDRNKDPISEIDRIAAASSNDTERENLFFLRDLIAKNSTVLAEERAETIKEGILNALFSAESVVNYSTRRKGALDELIMLKRMKTRPESAVLESFDSDIAKAEGTISLCDNAIDYFLRYYIQKIGDIQRYPEDLFENQLAAISQELRLDATVSYSFKKRLDLFKKHVSLRRSQGVDMGRDKILKDIVYSTGY